MQAPNPYLDYLIDPSFQEVNRLFVLSIENTTDRTVHTQIYFQTVEVKDYDQEKIMLWSMDKTFSINQQKIISEQMTTFEKFQLVKGIITWLVTIILIDTIKMIAIDLSKQQALDVDPKIIQPINFTRKRRKCIYNNVFHYWRSERNHLRFCTRAVRVFWMILAILAILFWFNVMSIWNISI